MNFETASVLRMARMARMAVWSAWTQPEHNAFR
jgi:hypothetical protein